MKHHAKASSAGSTQATGSSRGLLRRALATRAVSRGSKGSGAPSFRRLRTPLALLTLAIAAFAITAAPAFAATTVKTPVISDVSYASAHLSGEVNSEGALSLVRFEYSTDEENWTPVFGGVINGGSPSKFELFQTDLGDLKGSTTYFVRVTASGGAVSPKPNPSFTTLTPDPTAVLSVNDASEVAYTLAEAKGEIDRPVKSNDVTCNFEYIGDDQYAANPVDSRFTGATPVPCDTGNPAETPGSVKATGHVPVSAKFAGLSPSTTYHLRLAVSNSGSSDSKEPANTFTTLGPVPSPSVLSINDASEVEYTVAHASGEVERPGGPGAEDPALDTACTFEYISDAQFTANQGASAPPFEGATPIPCDPPNPITEPGTPTVEATLTGLAASTKYHLRLSASNQGGTDAKDAASTFTTTGPIPKPAVLVTGNATDVSFSTAKVSGEVQRPVGDDPGLNTSCRFEYVTDEQFTSNPPGEEFAGAEPVDCVEAPSYAPLTGADPTIVTAELTGLPLSPIGTKYHLRLTAENGGGTTSKDAATTFTTLASKEPTFEIHPVSPADVSYTTVHNVTATIDAGVPDHPMIFKFELSTNPAQGWPISENGFVHTSEPGKHDYSAGEILDGFQGLKPATTYFVRITARDFLLGKDVNSPAPYESFTTLGTTDPPLASCDPVTGSIATTAHISCAVDPNAPAGPLPDDAKALYKTTWKIECTPECKDVNGNGFSGTIDAEAESQPVTGDLARLDPNTHYEVKVMATNGLGTTESTVQTFDTDKAPPSVTQTPGASDGEGGYTLQGVVNPNKETITACEFKWGPNAPAYAFSAPCSPLPSPGAKPTTVEAHLTGLNADVDYHSLLVVTYGAGLKADSGEDQIFKATLATKEVCPNGQQRAENNSLALPECRAYEMVSPPGKEGFGAKFATYDGGDRVAYTSESTNIARSGAGSSFNWYVSARSDTGWETIPNLNGSSGSMRDAPSYVDSTYVSTQLLAYSPDLRSSVWQLHRQGDPGDPQEPALFLRSPDGAFTLFGSEFRLFDQDRQALALSPDLSRHFIWNSQKSGPGIYEFVGTANEQPHRVDIDNNGTPISTCSTGPYPAVGKAVSADGRVMVFSAGGGCGGANPAADELWARVNGTTSVDVSGSHCTRPDCNAPAKPTFVAATPDGSRVFFTTTQQLVNEDTDQTNDIYACDIPAGNPAPSADKANPCAAFRQVSAGDPTGAAVEGVNATSENGATVLFTAKGVLTDNKDALGEKAVAGDHNLYVWRTDASHPDGQINFVGRLDSNDLSAGFGQVAQATPDGRYLVFTTATQLLDADTDTARDVYRYDADTGGLTRASTNVFGVGGNGNGLDARTSPAVEHHPTTTISDDGQKIVFTTTEALSPADGNAEPDVYLWTPARVSLISTGASGSAPRHRGGNGGVSVAIDSSGEDIYFETALALTPADPDTSADIYDARIGGGFNFAPKPSCAGEQCQPDPTPASPVAPSPANSPNGDGNAKATKPCPKGKVRKKSGKCVKKPSKKHSGKKHHGKKHKRAGSKSGGGK